MKNLVLFYAPRSCALVPYVSLKEAGATFDVHVVDHNNGGNFTPEFRALNPKTKLPVLLINGQPLTENVAILLWITHNFPQADLIPKALNEKFDAISFIAWFASGIHPHLTPHNRPSRYCDLPGSETSVRRLATRALMLDFEICEVRLANQEWFFDHFSIVDIYFYWCFRRARSFGLQLSHFIHCMAHFHRMQQRTSVQDVIAFEQNTLQQLRPLS